MEVKPKGPFKRFAPGVVIDSNGAAVINAADVLTALGLEDTPENRIQVIESVSEEMARQMPGAQLFTRRPGDSAWRKERNGS